MTPAPLIQALVSVSMGTPDGGFLSQFAVHEILLKADATDNEGNTVFHLLPFEESRWTFLEVEL